MKKIKFILSVILFVWITIDSNAQTKGMYVEVFGSYILPNADQTLKTKLVTYAKDNSFNYLILSLQTD